MGVHLIDNCNLDDVAPPAPLDRDGLSSVRSRRSVLIRAFSVAGESLAIF
jgi:hypothetical protein